MRTLVAMAAVVLAVGACGDDSPQEEPPSSAPAPQVLALGKSTFALESGTAYESPRGFEPVVTVTANADGWVSTHRGLDAFDLSQPVPDADAALVVYAFVVPVEATAEEAVAAIGQRAEAAGAELEQTGDLTWTVTGGDGPLITSRDGGIALDAVPTGYARVTAVQGEPFLTVWWVPDTANADDAEGLSGTLDVGYEFSDS
jgi:hypothetical protein